MVENPSLGRHIDEMQMDAHAISGVAALSRSSTLQEYIDGVCSISCPLWPIIKRGLLLQANLVGREDKVA